MNALISAVVGHPWALKHRTESARLAPPVAQVIPLMLQATGASAHTLARLSDAPGLHTRDCYGIARSIHELSVNLCYILAQGPEAAERALRHARQKSYLDLQRESTIGDSVIRVEWSGRPDLSSVPGLEEDIAAFTARGGREKGWIDDSIDDRIAAVGRAFGKAILTNLHFARFMVYRHSSEILHGTLFSVLYFLGGTAPRQAGSRLEGIPEHVGQQHMLLLLASGISMDAVVIAFDKTCGFAWAVERSEELTRTIGEIPFFRDGPTVAPGSDASV